MRFVNRNGGATTGKSFSFGLFDAAYHAWNFESDSSSLTYLTPAANCYLTIMHADDCLGDVEPNPSPEAARVIAFSARK
jgi:hypothetical protein